MKSLAILLILTGCAQVDAKNMTCWGFCTVTEAHKGESPIKPNEIPQLPIL
jgi:hypothetical protein